MSSPDDFSWAFGNETYKSYSEFLKGFTEYNQEINGMKPPLKDFTLCGSNAVLLRFEGVDDEYSDDDEFESDTEYGYQERETTIKSSSGKELTFFEFMYLANEALYRYLREADHMFFEGVEFEGERNGVPVVSLVMGS